MSQMFRLQLLFLGGLLCVMLTRSASLPALAAFSSRSQTLQTNDGDGWKESPSIQDMEDLQLIYDLTRPTRHADGLFTSGYSKLLGQLSAKDYLESLIAKRVNGDLMEGEFPVKRHSDAVFTDNYSRYRKQMAVKKYLNSMLQGKRSVEDPSMSEVSIRTEPSSSSPSSSSQQTSEDVALQDFISHLTLAL